MQFWPKSSRVHSVTKLHEMSYGARLDDDLFQLLQVTDNRLVLRRVLIESCFSEAVGAMLLEQSEVNKGAYLYSRELLDRARQRIKDSFPDSESGQNSAVRDQGFRRAVRQAYDYTCAMTGIRIITDDGHVAVVGAHIIPWSRNYDDNLTNGIALSPTCHWAFDEGLMTVSNSLLIRVSPQLSKGANAPRYLADYDGARLNLPDDESLWPDPSNLRWHRQHVFRRL